MSKRRIHALVPPGTPLAERRRLKKRYLAQRAGRPFGSNQRELGQPDAPRPRRQSYVSPSARTHRMQRILALMDGMGGGSR